ATGGSQQRHKLTGRERQRQLVERDHAGEDPPQLLEPDLDPCARGGACRHNGVVGHTRPAIGNVGSAAASMRFFCTRARLPPMSEITISSTNANASAATEMATDVPASTSDSYA